MFRNGAPAEPFRRTPRHALQLTGPCATRPAQTRQVAGNHVGSRGPLHTTPYLFLLSSSSRSIHSFSTAFSLSFSRNEPLRELLVMHEGRRVMLQGGTGAALQPPHGEPSLFPTAATPPRASSTSMMRRQPPWMLCCKRQRDATTTREKCYIPR